VSSRISSFIACASGVLAKQLLLGWRRHARADDPDHMRDYSDPSADWSDGKEPVLIVTVLCVVDHQIV